VLAAAGLIALHKMSQRLDEDHRHAALLADQLRQCSFIAHVKSATNMVYVDLAPNTKVAPEELPGKLKEKGVLIGGIRNNTFRLVTHHYITEKDIHTTVAALREVLG